MAGRKQEKVFKRQSNAGSYCQETVCIYASDITYFDRYAHISPAASFSNFQAKNEELAETPLTTLARGGNSNL